LNKANVEGWSAAEIARRSGDRIHRATAANVMRGKHAANPSDDVLEAFAAVFPSLSLPKLRELAGRPSGEAEPYIPPPEAALLNARQRKALDELIRSMAAEDALPRQALELLDRSDPESVTQFLKLGSAEFITWARAHRERQYEDFDDWAVEAGKARLAEAARKGTGKLRAVRDAQDESGEAPDPEGPEDGA
jgi:transcriptional regulator with XRE-family HTH domain